jgi:hypothetical protein
MGSIGAASAVMAMTKRFAWVILSLKYRQGGSVESM